MTQVVTQVVTQVQAKVQATRRGGCGAVVVGRVDLVPQAGGTAAGAARRTRMGSESMSCRDSAIAKRRNEATEASDAPCRQPER